MERKKIDWDSHFRKFESSTQRAAEYCNTSGLNLGTFRSNLYKYRARQNDDASFTEITVNTELTLSVNEYGQIILTGIEPDILPTLIRAWSDALSQ